MCSLQIQAFVRLHSPDDVQYSTLKNVTSKKIDASIIRLRVRECCREVVLYSLNSSSGTVII